MCNQITQKFVDNNVASWESRHDEWVRDHLAPTLESSKLTMRDIRDEFKEKLRTDWRVSFGFLLDRTTYQRRRDSVNCRTATYLMRKVCDLPDKFQDSALEAMLDSLQQDKLNGKASHLRQSTDVSRVESITRFLTQSSEKNITITMLGRIAAGGNVIDFLKQFSWIGDKTANFYLKFICWIFELDELPIVVDRHVLTSLKESALLSDDNPREAVKAIIQIAQRLERSPIEVETALYESSWQQANRCSF